MRRRHYLGLLASSGLAGCLGSTSGTPESDASDGEPTVKTTTTVNVEARKVLQFGEWYTTADYGFTVTDISSKTSLMDTFNDRVLEMPEGEQFVYADIKAKNITQEIQNDPGTRMHPFAFIYSGKVREATGSIEHPEAPKGLDLDWLGLANAKQRMQGVGVGSKIASGQVKEFWIGASMSADVALEDVEIGLEDSGRDKFGVRWRQ